MNVIIVAKTLMSNAVCVGGLATSGKFVRLLDGIGYNQPINTDFEIRQVWNLVCQEKPKPTAPHIEDILIFSKKLKGTLNEEITMLQIAERYNAPIWRGSPDGLFDNCLSWTEGGSGYVSIEGEIPGQSVGFWIPDRDLTKRVVYERVRYNYPNIKGWRSLAYVGFEQAVEVIPAGTLVRFSLSRWWDRDGETEDRCSLQLSGWYDLP